MATNEKVATNESQVNGNQTKKIGFFKKIENDFFILGHYIKDEFFELTSKEANHPKVKNAIKLGLIKKK